MLQLQLTVTLGDLIVSGATITAIIGAYFAVKGQLQTTSTLLEQVNRRLDGHDEEIGDLQENAYGRRKSDHKPRKV